MTTNQLPFSPAPIPLAEDGQRAASRKPRRSLQADFAAELKAHNIPYVSVDEAKRSLFSNTRLLSFHFVAYSRAGPNWLVWCGERKAQSVQAMREWERVFGEGFISRFCVRRKNGLAYLDLAGQPVSFSELSAHVI